MKRLATFALLSALSLTSWANPITNLFKSTTTTPNPEVLKLAKSAYDCAVLSGKVAKPQTLTVIDYSLASSMKRLWVIDMKNNQVLYNTLVAHGQGSGGAIPTRFSNTSSSHATSLGLFKTGDTYQGRNGFSMRLIGLDDGFNSNALSRAVVMHGAPYVSDARAKSGFIGRSWGCPAVPQKLAAPIINTIKGGNLVFAYYPDSKLLKKSKYLNCSSNALMANNASKQKTA